jgi:hypothetical protein
MTQIPSFLVVQSVASRYIDYAIPAPCTTERREENIMVGEGKGQYRMSGSFRMRCRLAVFPPYPLNDCLANPPEDQRYFATCVTPRRILSSRMLCRVLYRRFGGMMHLDVC